MNIGQYAQAKKYAEAISLIKEVDDVILILAHAYENEGYEITGETSKVAELLVEHAQKNFTPSFISHIAVNISENKTNVETYFMNAETASDSSIISGDNPCISIYEKLINELYIVSIKKSNTQDDDEIISDYLEYEGYTLEAFKEKYLRSN
jgi:hypothetical protein